MSTNNLLNYNPVKKLPDRKQLKQCHLTKNYIKLQQKFKIKHIKSPDKHAQVLNPMTQNNQQ